MLLTGTTLLFMGELLLMGTGSRKVALCRVFHCWRERERGRGRWKREREDGKHSGFSGKKVLREFRIEGLDHEVDDKHE